MPNENKWLLLQLEARVSSRRLSVTSLFIYFYSKRNKMVLSRWHKQSVLVLLQFLPQIRGGCCQERKNKYFTCQNHTIFVTSRKKICFLNDEMYTYIYLYDVPSTSIYIPDISVSISILNWTNLKCDVHANL